MKILCISRGWWARGGGGVGDKTYIGIYVTDFTISFDTSM